MSSYYEKFNKINGYVWKFYVTKVGGVFYPAIKDEESGEEIRFSIEKEGSYEYTDPESDFNDPWIGLEHGIMIYANGKKVTSILFTCDAWAFAHQCIYSEADKSYCEKYPFINGYLLQALNEFVIFYHKNYIPGWTRQDIKDRVW